MKKLERLENYSITTTKTTKILGGRHSGQTSKDLAPITTQSGSCADVKYVTTDDDGRAINSCTDVVCP